MSQSKGTQRGCCTLNERPSSTPRRGNSARSPVQKLLICLMLAFTARLAVQGVEGETTAAEGNDLQEAAGDRNVLEKVDELVLVAQIVVEAQGSGDRGGGS